MCLKNKKCLCHHTDLPDDHWITRLREENSRRDSDQQLYVGYRQLDDRERPNALQSR